MSALSLSSIHCDRKGSVESWLGRDPKGAADVWHEKPHSFLYADTQLGTPASSVAAFQEAVLLIWEQWFTTDR